MNDSLPRFPAWRRWRRRLAWLLLIVLSLLVASWALLPRAVHYLADDWARSVGRTLTLGRVEFVPWALRLQLDDIRLAEPGGAPLFAAQRLLLDAEALPLLLGRLQLAELTLTAPRLWAVRDGGGRWNWARLLHDIQAGAAPAKADEAPPKFTIHRLALRGGRLQLDDALAGGVRRRVLPLDFQLQNLSTLPGEGGRYRLAATLDDGASLRWHGRLQLQPLASSGELQLQGLTLAALWPYAQPYLKLAAPQGRLALTLPYRFELHGRQPSLIASGVRASLDGLQLQAPGSGSQLRLRRIELHGGRLDLARRQLAIGALTLQGGELATVLDAADRPDWLAALPTSTPASATPAGKAPGWQLQLSALRLQDWRLSASHAGFITPLRAEAQLAQLAASVGVDAGGGVRIGGAILDLRQLRLASGRQAPFASLAALQLAASDVDLAARRLHPGAVQLHGLALQLTRDARGGLQLNEILRRQPLPPARPAAAAGAGWQLSPLQLRLSGGELDWRDASTAPAVALRLHDIGGELAGDGAQGWDWRLAAALATGRLALSGKIAAKPGPLTARLEASRLPLAGVAPYALQHTVLRFGGGELSAALALAVDGGRWQASGSLALDRLALYEPGQREVLLGWRQLQLNGLQAQPQRIDIADIRLQTPQLRLILDAQRVPNFAHLLKPSPAGRADSPPPPAVHIRALRVRDGKMDFADLGLNPSFGARIHSLSGTVLGLSSQAGRRGTVTLDGRVDEFGDVRVRGTLTPQAPTEDMDIAANFRNIPLSSLNPYSVSFAGWHIRDGRLGAELQYRLQARQLQGDNRMVVDHIQLGEEVADYQGTRLPLRLAVALLEDSDGRIDLSLPVAGSLDEPTFSYGHLVWQAIRNILLKVVTAPFRALFGGEGFDDIYADAGDDRIPPPEREKLGKLAELLAKRPKLALTVGGGYDAARDAPALARQRVDGDILKRAGYPLQPDEPLPLPDLGDARVRQAVGAAYAAHFGRIAWLKKVALAADTPARAQALRDELLAAQAVDEAALKALAAARGDAARQLLLAARPELAARIAVQPPAAVKADKDGVPLLLKLQ